jgi:hypothetical protein
MTAFGLAVTVFLPGFLRLALFMQFLAGLDRVQPFGHRHTPPFVPESAAGTCVAVFPGTTIAPQTARFILLVG